MSENSNTADLALSYQPIPRLNEAFYVDESSYVDLMLPSSGSGSERSRLRLYDINDRWIKAVDLSGLRFVPEHDEPAFLDAPHSVLDNFELDQPFALGRHHNPDNLPILNKNVVSRSHIEITLRMGHHGLILALLDLSSHNGTDLVDNETIQRVDATNRLSA